MLANLFILCLSKHFPTAKLTCNCLRTPPVFLIYVTLWSFSVGGQVPFVVGESCQDMAPCLFSTGEHEFSVHKEVFSQLFLLMSVNSLGHVRTSTFINALSDFFVSCKRCGLIRGGTL